jgi:hypothetical protein
MARRPAPRVRAILTAFRHVASEIVVAVDATGDPRLPSLCHELADVWRVVEPGPLNRWIGWLHGQCDGEWVLRLEDDEVPSAALVNRLPELVAERAPTHYALPRRWLYPAPDRYIASHPWWPDYQVRLVRNIPGILSFPGVLHEPIAVLGERRSLDVPLYHCDCLLAGLDERRRKRERYEGVRAHTTIDGFPVNAMYTPEDCGQVATLPVPHEDLLLIEKAGIDDGYSSEVELREATEGDPLPLAEADRFSSARIVPESAYRARVTLIRPPEALAAGSTSDQEVEVENLGDERWPSEFAGEPLIRLASRWLPGPEGPRTAFTETVDPGRSTRATLRVVAPPNAGRHVLEVDVVHEHVRWFGTGVRQVVEVS